MSRTGGRDAPRATATGNASWPSSRTGSGPTSPSRVSSRRSRFLRVGEPVRDGGARGATDVQGARRGLSARTPRDLRARPSRATSRWTAASCLLAPEPRRALHARRGARAVLVVEAARAARRGARDLGPRRFNRRPRRRRRRAGLGGRGRRRRRRVADRARSSG